ncbi:MAG: hypothetical protein AAGE94_17000 [Acidobacteriota bacterium]
MTDKDPNHHRLEDLGRAMTLAMSHSTEIAAAVERLRREGFSLYLVLDPNPLGPARNRFELRLTPESGEAVPSDRRPSSVPATAALRPVDRPRRPEFRLDADDVHLLRSMGIDATRPGRRRR